ncbi:MAG TPA: SDR family oxidoreductase [Candidatus Bilamarchaeum sp.]|nr:SDR family oxidoreductase [Candidatus Bilamarchaeum sp.]
MADCLVTGGAGFIGSHIAELLLSAGHAVTILDNLSSGRKSSIPHGAKLVRGSVTDRKAVDKAMEGIDCVFHEAAIVSVAFSMKEPIKTMEVNAGGTGTVLESALSSGAKKVVIASSAAVYGDSPPPLREDSPLRPISPYGESKLACERLAGSYSKEHGLKAVSLRYFNVYGPRQDPSSPYSGVIARFMDAARRGGRPTIFGDGTQTRDFIYVKDVARANLHAMERGESGEFNIGSGKPVSVLWLWGSIKGIARSGGEPEFAPAREGDIKHSLADISKAKKSLGFEPGYSLEAGLRETWTSSGPQEPPSPAQR